MIYHTGYILLSDPACGHGRRRLYFTGGNADNFRNGICSKPQQFTAEIHDDYSGLIIRLCIRKPESLTHGNDPNNLAPEIDDALDFVRIFKSDHLNFIVSPLKFSGCRLIGQLLRLWHRLQTQAVPSFPVATCFSGCRRDGSGRL